MVVTKGAVKLSRFTKYPQSYPLKKQNLTSSVSFSKEGHLKLCHKFYWTAMLTSYFWNCALVQCAALREVSANTYSQVSYTLPWALQGEAEAVFV